MRDMKDQKDKQTVKGMIVYCDNCKKHTGVHSIASGNLVIIKLYTDCCNKIIK